MPRKQKTEAKKINSAEDIKAEKDAASLEDTHAKGADLGENTVADTEAGAEAGNEAAQEAAQEAETTKISGSGSNGEYVEYCLPFLPGRKKGDSHTVTINGKNYQVQYGVPVKVPAGVKEILEGMVMQNEMVERKIHELTKEERCLAKFE